MILVARDIGGTIEWYAPSRPAAGPTVQVVNQAGGTEVAAGTAATLDAVDTTIAVGVSAGDVTLTVTLGTNITAGRRYLISKTGEPSESVLCERVSGTTVYLANPLAYAHASTADFEGTRISYTIAAAIADTEEENWRAVFSWSIAAVAQAPGVVEFTVTRHPIYNPAGVPDLYAVSTAALRARIAMDTCLGDTLTRAWDEVLDTLQAQGVRVGTIVGTDKLKRSVVYRALGLLAEQYGRDYRDERTELAERYSACLAMFKGSAALDDNEDDSIEEYEKRPARGGELWRG